MNEFHSVNRSDSFYLPSLHVNRIWFDMQQEIVDAKELERLTSPVMQEYLRHVLTATFYDAIESLCRE